MTPGCGDLQRVSFGPACQPAAIPLQREDCFCAVCFSRDCAACKCFCSTGSVSFANCPAASFFDDSFLYSLISSWWSLTIDFANELSNQEPESTFSFA